MAHSAQCLTQGAGTMSVLVSHAVGQKSVPARAIWLVSPPQPLKGVSSGKHLLAQAMAQVASPAALHRGSMPANRYALHTRTSVHGQVMILLVTQS